MDPAPVSIIIPNYNGEQILSKNFSSVVKATRAYPGESEILVVDDASQDNSIRFIEEKFPKVRIVRHDINKGFIEAVHSGIKSSIYPIIILLNTDLRPDREFIRPLVRWFNRYDTFSVSPLILDQCGKPLRVSWNLGKIVRGEIRKHDWNLEDALKLARQGQSLKSLYASGGSVAIRKEMFLDLGGFLSIFKPFYYEDRDLCTRAWQRGWKTYFEPESKVVHDHQRGTIKRFFAEKQTKIIRRRNRLFYLWLHLSTRKLIFSHIPWLLIRLLLRTLRLDLIYPIALFKALPSLEEIIKLRCSYGGQEHKPLEKIVKKLNSYRNSIMFRIIVFSKSKRRTRTTSHLVRAFREQGNETLWINPFKIRRWKKNKTDRWILRRINTFKPDIVFVYSQDIPLAVLEEIATSNVKTVMYYEDMAMTVPPSLTQKGCLVDFFLATNKGMLLEYQKSGIFNPIYFVGACDRYDHRRRSPILPLWKSDIAFIGKARSDEPRVALTKRLSEKYNVKVYGKGWSSFGLKATLKTVTPKRYGLICEGAKIMLGADLTSDVEGYWSNRLWLTLGCGGFFLTAYVKGMEDFFENKKHLVWYRDEKECLNLVEEYLYKSQERRKIALEGYRLVHRHHTFHHFVDRLISLCTNKD